MTPDSDVLGEALKYSGLEYTTPEHHDAGRILPSAESMGNTWLCSCGRAFVTQRARSNHFSFANNR